MELDTGTLLQLGGLALVIVLLGVLLVRRPGAHEQNARESLTAEKDDWRARFEDAQDQLSETREALARAETVVAERDAMRTSLETLREEKSGLERQLSALKAEHEAAARHHGEKLDELEKAREKLAETFKLTAAEVLRVSGEELNKKSAAGLQGLLEPLKTQLKDFREKVEKDANDRSSHAGEIKTLMEVVRKDASQMSEDAKSLTNALRSSSKVQGDWGELVLATILERAGLREGQEFFTQQSETTEDGGRLRPDIVVDMPGQQRLVIDSKVSLKAFDRCVNSEDEEDRNAALKQHLASVRGHIKSLGEKNYGQLYEGVSFTLMFVPLEGAASLALQSDPELAQLAWERDVMITTPTTLMMAMRTVQNLWTIDRQNRHALDIADRAGALYDKFAGFVEDLDKVGAQIDTARRTWGKAKDKLVAGQGNVIRQTEMLKSLGAKARKALPQEYLDASGVEPEALAIEAPEQKEAVTDS